MLLNNSLPANKNASYKSRSQWEFAVLKSWRGQWVAWQLPGLEVYLLSILNSGLSVNFGYLMVLDQILFFSAPVTKLPVLGGRARRGRLWTRCQCLLLGIGEGKQTAYKLDARSFQVTFCFMADGPFLSTCVDFGRRGAEGPACANQGLRPSPSTTLLRLR